MSSARSIDPKVWRKLSMPAKVRLRWRLIARKKQLTPPRHALCKVPVEQCEEALAAVLVTIPDEASAIAYLGAHGRAVRPGEEGDCIGDARTLFLAKAGHYDWLIWLILAGRGWGKTRTGAEDVIKFALEHPGARIALVAATFADGRDTMVEGESGIRSILPKSLEQNWNRSMGELFLTNGSQMKIFSAEEPERLRGPQHHRAWCDELAAWTYLQDTWDMMMFGLRLGENPQAIITTTPKPLKFIKKMLKRATSELGGVVTTTGSTFENARNLARAALQELRETYEDTRMGKQELYAEVLEDFEGALWTQQMIDGDRLEQYMVPDPFEILGRVVTAVDPAVTSSKKSNETGIVTVGLTRGPCPFCYKATKPHGIVLEDSTVGRVSPETWASAAVAVWRRWRGDRIVAEGNNGGELVETVIAAAYPGIPVKMVNASRGKFMRAEPVAALYEKHLVHHLGHFSKLEGQMTSYTDEKLQNTPKKKAGEDDEDSPDHLDALVWALTELFLPKNSTTHHGAATDTRHTGRR